MRILKKLTLSFALAAGLSSGIGLQSATAIEPQKIQLGDIEWKTNPLPLTPEKNEKTFQDGLCNEFLHASSNDYSKKLTHNCILDLGNKSKLGLSINIDEDRIGGRYVITPSAGIGFRF